jgi:hypothetical protein
MQEYLVPKLHVDYTALASKISKQLLMLKEFHIQHQKIRQDSERWGTMLEWQAIQEKVALFYLPYDDLNTLNNNNIQRKQDEEERQRVNKQKQAERYRRVIARIYVLVSLFVCIWIFGLIMSNTAKAPVAIVSATPSSPIVVVDNKTKKKNKEKKEDRVPLEDYLKGIENACDFSKAPKKLLSLTLGPVKKIYGPLENDYTYVYPPNKNIVKEFPELYKSVPIVEDKGNHFEASAKINGIFYGLAASKLIEGIGDENGIGFFTIVFDSPNAEAVLSKKFKFTTTFVESNGGWDYGVGFTVKNGKTHMTCDWSD